MTARAWSWPGVAAGAGAIAAAWVLSLPGRPVLPADASSLPSPSAQPVASAPAAATVAPAPKAPTDAIADSPACLLLLPDGTSVPALNGAVAPPPLLRALGGRPLAPIVGLERSPAGIDWYVHADGSRSTTEMRWRQDLARFDALTRTAQPVAGTPAVAAR